MARKGVVAEEGSLVIDPVIDSLMTQVSSQLTKQFPPDIEFALFVFRKGQGRRQARYGSNAERQELVEMLGNFVDFERGKQLDAEAKAKQGEHFDENDAAPPPVVES